MPALCMVALTVPADNLGCRRFHRVCGTIDCRPKICKEEEEAQKMLLNSKSVLLCKLCETVGGEGVVGLGAVLTSVAVGEM